MFQPLNTVTALLSGADLANIFAPSIITWQSPSLSISARMPARMKIDTIPWLVTWLLLRSLACIADPPLFVDGIPNHCEFEPDGPSSGIRHTSPRPNVT